MNTQGGQSASSIGDILNGEPKLRVGWQEWISLPELGQDSLRVKVDTGARTSSLHAWSIVPAGKTEDGSPARKISIKLGEGSADAGASRSLVVPVRRYATVTLSSGRKERRPVILTRIQIGPVEKIIEVNVTNREAMRFRMILGRSALEGDFVVDVTEEFLLGFPPGEKP